MNIDDTPAQVKFRAEVRRWIEEDVPRHLKSQRQGIVQGFAIGDPELLELNALTLKRGWRAPGWPTEYGGGGFDVAQMVIFKDEWNRAGMPPSMDIGVDNLGPILIRYGSPQQKRRFLGATLSGEITWAQGYSEPQAGSDLANLALHCDVHTDGFTLNGQKIWTSQAHRANWLFLLARTDASPKRKQEGISILLVRLDSPGLTVRPIETMDGYAHFCETFFDNVRVPRDQLLGQLHQGWTAAKGVLGFERFTHPTADPETIGRALDNLKRAARNAPWREGVVWDDRRFRRTVSALDMDVDSLRYTRYRALTRVMQEGEPGPESMMFKLFGAELMQRIVDLHHLALGPVGAVWAESQHLAEDGESARHVANIRAATIRGGTSEVQRNIIAKHVLRLP